MGDWAGIDTNFDITFFKSNIFLWREHVMLCHSVTCMHFLLKKNPP